MNYFDKKAVSNSKIGEWQRLLQGDTLPFSRSQEANFLFGSVFHAILAGEDIAEKFEKLKPHERFAAMKMSKKIRKELGHIITKKVSVEKEYFWVQEFETIGKVRCKAKTDLVYQDEFGLHCLDYKTTSASSYEEFLSSVMAFSYHRQAAWYFLADNFVSFTIVGISKQPSHDIYVLPPFSSDDVLIEAGLQECIEILQKVRNLPEYAEYFEF
ncbi:PD-(D/E)XK nuclease-like domain-containing protein [Raineya sp.]